MADVPIGSCAHLAEEEGNGAVEGQSRSGVRAMRQRKVERSDVSTGFLGRKFVVFIGLYTEESECRTSSK